MADMNTLPNGDHSYEIDANVSVNVDVETKTYVPLKSDAFIVAAGLQRSGTSGRKSSVEKLLEQSLNTSEASENSDLNNSSTSVTSPIGNVSSDSDEDDGARRRGRVSAEKPANLKSDEFIKDAGLSRTGQVPRKSAKEKLLEDQLQTSDNTNPSRYDGDGDRYLIRKNTPPPTVEGNQTSSSNDGEKKSKSGRKSSVYEQKQIEAPVAMKGNRITSRTENLFKQYERDMTVHEPRPITNVNEAGSFSVVKENYNDAVSDEKRKVDIARDEKEQELREMRIQYQQRLSEEEQREAEERAKRIANEELKSVYRLGDIKNRYLSVAAGQSKQSDNEDEEKEHVDKFGGKIEKSGGQIQVVASADGVSNIRERFGSIGKVVWKKRNSEGTDTDQVDSNKINSARNIFKQFETNGNNSGKKSFNRPTSRKVKNPKELMDMRKKITYGGDSEELPQDGVIKKSVILDDNELGKSLQKEALSVYKNLENAKEECTPVEKPKNRLLSDSETRANMEVKKIENSDCGDNADVSGYDTGTPCSPTSTASDGYSSLSDTKEVSQTDDLDDFTETKLSVNQPIDVSSPINNEDSSIEVAESEDVYENVHLV